MSFRKYLESLSRLGDKSALDSIGDPYVISDLAKPNYCSICFDATSVRTIQVYFPEMEKMATVVLVHEEKKPDKCLRIYKEKKLETEYLDRLRKMTHSDRLKKSIELRECLSIEDPDDLREWYTVLYYDI